MCGAIKHSRMLRLALIVAVLAASPAIAHELGGARVSILFERGGGYALNVSIDPAHVPDVDPKDPRAVALHFAQFATLAFDGVAEPLHIDEAQIESLTDGRVRLRLRGKVPAGVRRATWTSSLTLNSQILELRNEGDAQPLRQWVPDGAVSLPFDLEHAPPAPTTAQVVLQYLWLGFTHIVPKGLDHILFVVGLFLLSRELKPLLFQVTAFTCAHTLSLALSMFGVVSLSPRIVEPAIALSIVFVAMENVLVKKLHPWRIAVVFAFGLLHGLGFAGVLTELGLPRGQFVPALLSFNVGVEGGQLAVLLTAFAALGVWAGTKPWYRARVTVPASLAIAAVGLFWAVQRVL